MHGERAVLEGGTRTSTIVAVTDCKLAVAKADELDRSALAELSTGHRREEG
jgi:CRP-like cAMP-binding protein